MSPVERIVQELKDLKFRLRRDNLTLFGESPPLLRAIAVDDRAHQLVLVAAQETEEQAEDADAADARLGEWKQLLFAIAGLRHHLCGSGLPGLGHPILLAVVDSAGVHPLRCLVEEIAEEYALFSRLDINIIDADRVGDEEGGTLGMSLATLLPRVRHAIDKEVTVATQDVEKFWERLRAEIRTAAGNMEDDFGTSAADVSAELLSELRGIGNGEEPIRDDRAPLPRPVSMLRIEGFRSFAEGRFFLPPVGVVYGANGSGKTSICETMEIIWSGHSQRVPDDIKLEEYIRHVSRDRIGFSLGYSFAGDPADADERVITEKDMTEKPTVSLGRSVLAQHVLAEMANGTPRERLGAFLKASGLALPELEKKRIDALRRAAFEDANLALGEAGIEPMRAVTSNAVEHLRRQLAGGFAAQLPPRDQLDGAAEALIRITGAAWKPRLSVASSDLVGLVSAVDAAFAPFAVNAARAPDPSQSIADAVPALRAEAELLREAADPLRLLTQQFSRLMSGPPESAAPTATPPSPVPPATAARWLSHVRGLEQSVAGLDELAPSIQDAEWRKRLEEYSETLHAAIRRSSANELEKMVSAEQVHLPPPTAAAQPDPNLLEAAGFAKTPQLSRSVIEAMMEVHAQLTDRAARLDGLAAALERHPARSFVSRAARIMPALFRFQLIRDLTAQRGSLARAQEALVEELLDERLFPVVQELVAALVRFEWYFKPLKFRSDKQGLHLTALATDDDSKDIRLLLNAAERTVVGIAWFLGLHILQPKEDRKVLVLDDPASGFDSINKAAFVATLRAVVRLLEPEQLLITTHDDTLVALLEQEFASVDGWPQDFEVLRCQRTAPGPSEVKPATEEEGQRPQADLASELRKLAFEPLEAPSAT